MIVLAEYGSGIYDIVLFLHVIAAFVAFAPAFVNPVFAALGRTDAPEVGRPLAGIQAKATKTLYLPALVAVGLLGIALIFLSDEVVKFSQTWISIAFLAWAGTIVVVAWKIGPLERAIAAGEAPFFSGKRALHLTELALALNAGVGAFTPQSDF